MPDPKGFLVVPVGFRIDGSIHSLALDDSDRLKVLIDSITGSVIVTQSNPANLFVGSHGYDGSNWQKLKVDSNGRLSVDINTIPTPLSSLQLDEDNKLIVSNTPHSIYDLSTVTQILKGASSNNNTVTVHTVTTGKSFYLSSVFVSIKSVAGGNGYASFFIQNSVPTTQSTYWFYSPVPGNQSYMLPFPVSIKLSSQWLVKINTPSLNDYLDVSIHGYEI